jgi:hypothetical protein
MELKRRMQKVIQWTMKETKLKGIETEPTLENFKI